MRFGTGGGHREQRVGFRGAGWGGKQLVESGGGGWDNKRRVGVVSCG